jgi:hypothetical protein
LKVSNIGRKKSERYNGSMLRQKITVIGIWIARDRIRLTSLWNEGNFI